MTRYIVISDGPAQPEPNTLDACWAKVLISHPELAGDYQVRSLGIDAETTEQIFGFIQSREKVATFSLPWVLEANHFPHPKVGMPILLCDYDGMPRLVVKLTDIRNITFGEMGINESSLDGPPVQDPDIWIPLHRNYWNGLLAHYGRECTDDMPVLIEPFDYIGEFT